MAADRTILRAQATALRVATDPARGGVPMKVIAADSGIPEATLRSYSRPDAPALMPLSALWKLCGVLAPSELNLLLPEGWALVPLPAGVDHDDLAAAAIEYAASHARARHPDSPGGVEIVPEETKALDQKVARLRQPG